MEVVKRYEADSPTAHNKSRNFTEVNKQLSGRAVGSAPGPDFWELIKQRNIEFMKFYNRESSEDVVSKIYLPTTVLFRDVEGRFLTNEHELKAFVYRRSLGENI